MFVIIKTLLLGQILPIMLQFLEVFPNSNMALYFYTYKTLKNLGSKDFRQKVANLLYSKYIYNCNH